MNKAGTLLGSFPNTETIGRVKPAASGKLTVNQFLKWGFIDRALSHKNEEIMVDGDQ
jgi:hypothetical protein